MSAMPDAVPAVTREVTVPYELDRGPERHRIGLVALDSDVATERDFHRMLPDDVMFYTARIHCEAPVTIDTLRKQHAQLPGAVRQLIPKQRVDVIAYSCTSGTVAIGYDAVRDAVEEGRGAPIPVVTPITSAIEGMDRLGMRRISLLTPYVDSVNQAMRGFLEERGIEVANIGSFCFEDDNEMARIPSEAILDAAVEVCRPDVDGLFISCTALRAVEIVERAEQRIGKPVLSAIQTLFWQSLRETGYRAPVEGYGSLLRL